MKTPAAAFISTVLILLLGACSSDNAYMTDKAGRKYKTIKIGDKIWMAENLNYETSTGSWCYNNNRELCENYGRLYTWETAIAVCPEGWHLPDNDEWAALIEYLKTNSNNAFNPVLGGFRFYDGQFNNIDVTGMWWSSSKLPQNEEVYRCVYFMNASTSGQDFVSGWFGASVRYVKDCN